METNQITGAVVDAAMRVHSRLGPGLLKQPYKKCLQHELVSRGFTVNTEVHLAVLYDSVLIDIGYRLDLLVNSEVIVEIKAVQAVSPVHRAQMLTYLKLARKHVRLLINFNVVHLKEGIERFVF
jgi:GxxExxY protein